MKIKIKTSDFRMWLYLPTSLFLSHLGVSIAVYFLRNRITVSESKKKSLVKEIKACKKQLKRFTLVDIQTSDGEEIFIAL